MATGTPPTPTDTAAPLHYASPRHSQGLPIWAIRWVLAAVVLASAVSVFDTLRLYGWSSYRPPPIDLLESWQHWLRRLPLALPLLALVAAAIGLLWPARVLPLLVGLTYLLSVAAMEASSVVDYRHWAAHPLVQRQSSYIYDSPALWTLPLAVCPGILFALSGRSAKWFVRVAWWSSLIAIGVMIAFSGFVLEDDTPFLLAWRYGARYGVTVVLAAILIYHWARGKRAYLAAMVCTMYAGMLWVCLAIDVAIDQRSNLPPLQSLDSVKRMLIWLIPASALLVARRLDRPSPVST